MKLYKIFVIMMVCILTKISTASGNFEIRITPSLKVFKKEGDDRVLSRPARQAGSLQSIDPSGKSFRPVEDVEPNRSFIPLGPLSFGPMAPAEPLVPKKPIDSYSESELDDHKRIKSRYEAPMCVAPNPVEGSEIVCQFTDTTMNCTQTCVFGHTMRSGIYQKFHCESGQWFGGPDKCQPFVDCSVTPGPGGSVKCLSNFMNKGTRCWTQCKDFEDKKATPMTKHACDIEGRWNPSLPHCVLAGSGMGLVPPPEKKLLSMHSETFDNILL